MKSYTERKQLREQELYDKLKLCGLKYDEYCNYGICQSYIQHGGKLNVDEIF